MKTYQQFIEAYDRATGRPHRGTDYHGRDYGGTPEDHERQKRTAKAMASLQGGWLKKEKELPLNCPGKPIRYSANIKMAGNFQSF